MLVSLPMYDWPEVATQTDSLWQLIANEFRQLDLPAPDQLNRSEPLERLWTGGDILFSQTCGWPLVEKLGHSVSLLCGPIYNVEGCKSTMYSSRIVCRASDTRSELKDFQGSTVVINGENSQSGFQAMKSSLVERSLSGPFFSKQLVSGAHRESAKMVAGGQADVCAIDPVSWQLANRFEPEITKQLRVIGETPYTPGLPFICSKDILNPDQLQTMQRSLLKLMRNLPEKIATDLMIAGAETVDYKYYQLTSDLDKQATESGHARLAP